MPAGTGGASGSNPNNNTNRTVFRPPWVKEGGPQPIPMPTAPWTLKNRESKGEESAQPPKFPQLRKTSGPNTQPKENGQPVPHLEQVQLRPTPKETKVPVQSEPKVIPIQIKREDSSSQPQERPKLVQQRTLKDTKERPIPPPPPKEPPAPKPPAVRRERPPPVTKKTTQVYDDDDIPSAHTLRKQDSILNIIPPAPPAPPAPPLPPPKPKVIPEGYKPISPKAAKVLESLRQRPRARPDWGSLLKDVEQGRKLRHVVCNDRSKPLLPATKAKTKDGEKFVYESEKNKSNPHNLLLKEIQSGVQLRKVQTNDRSKPNLEGLRKFRRQMTIEDIQKSQSAVKLGTTPDNVEEIIIADEVDEMDDIDKLRDDLQSTKQLLALELRNVEAQQKENKRLQARIANLEVELDHERGKAAASVTRSVLAERMEDDILVQNLKQEVEEARKQAKEAEKKYIKCSDELDTVKGELDEAKRQNEILQKKLDAALKALSGRRESQAAPNMGEEQDEEPMEAEESESEEEDEDEDNEEKREKRAKREIKMLVNKLKNVKTKKENAKKERQSLKQQMKQEQQNIKEERKNYKRLQREVDKMAELMNTDEDANEEKEKEKEETEDDEEQEDVEEVEEEETSESESESSSESEDEEEQSESEPEDAPFEKRKENYTSRVRRYENQLAALKKGNYLLKANIDRLRDDINKQREMSKQLKEDLDSILNDLG